MASYATGRATCVERCRLDAGSLLESFLDGESYEARKCSQLAVQLSDVIKARTKELPLPRYKLVVNVTVGQSTGQSVSCVNRSRWNDIEHRCLGVRDKVSDLVLGTCFQDLVRLGLDSLVSRPEF